MKRRFGRARRGGGRGWAQTKNPPLDATHWLGRVVEAGVIPVRSLEPVSEDDISASFAALGAGETEDGTALVVAVSPRSGGDAALAAIAHAQRLAEDEGFDGEAVAVAPQWTIACRRRLGLIGPLPFRFRAIAASSLGDGTVEPEAGQEPGVLPARQVAEAQQLPERRELFLRALVAFEGLAAKHGGAVRGVDARVELVLLARRVAVLSADDDGVSLDTILPERSSARLAPESLATEMDHLEGQLRKRLNDRRARSSEEGLRAQMLPSLAAAAGVREALPWPLPGSDPEVLDLAGVVEDGAVAIAAVRARLTLAALGSVVDAAIALRPALPVLLARTGVALRPGPPRLLLAAREYDGSAVRVLPAFALEHVTYDLRPKRGGGLAVERREAPAPAEAQPVAPALGAVEQGDAAAEPAPGKPAPEKRRGPRFEEISLFDLEGDGHRGAVQSDGEEPVARRSRRGRRRGRRTRAPSAEEARSAGESREDVKSPKADQPKARGTPKRGERRGQRRGRTDEDLDEDMVLVGGEIEDLREDLAPIDEEVPEPEEESESIYDDEEDLGDEERTDEDRLRGEREAQRRASLAKAAPEAEPEKTPQPPRRRVAIVAHADRASLMAGILLARDVRLVEGLWVYPQAELMTFFRSIATDLREETPIHLVGFTASPARDTLQAAALYRGRLSWFDHHDWPPEDLEALRNAIGPENVHVEPGTESCVPAILAQRTRRSRFSDKFVELVTGRFSDHDYARWGRLWWHRLGEIVTGSGEQRSAIEPLLAGRPSDLAREAASVPQPPVPSEVAYVSERDFRLVHFGGYTMTVVPTPPGLDLHLAARVARERYLAQISVAFTEGEELVVLGADEARGRRNLDLGQMVEHLAAKHEWIEALSGGDQVSRMRVKGMAAQPDRLDEVIGEIAMGRSVLEG